jgi:hypothetical protein
MDEGLNLETSLLQKLWRVASIQGHFDPWHPRLLERNEAQLDAILELYSQDNPKELKFERRKTREARERPLRVMKGWADVLIGQAKEGFVGRVSFKLPAKFSAVPRGGKLSVNKPPAPGKTPPRPKPRRG